MNLRFAQLVLVGALLLLCLGTSYADVVMLSMPNDKKILVVIPPWLSFSKTSPEGLPPTLLIKATREGDMELRITFLPIGKDLILSSQDVDKVVRESASHYLETSVEKEITPVTIASKNGFGSYASFTDASKVNMTSLPPGEWKVATTGVLVTGKIMSAFTVLSNDTQCANYRTALGVISEGIQAP